jgi:hypothetical protein
MEIIKLSSKSLSKCVVYSTCRTSIIVRSKYNTPWIRKLVFLPFVATKPIKGNDFSYFGSNNHRTDSDYHISEHQSYFPGNGQEHVCGGRGGNTCCKCTTPDINLKAVQVIKLLTGYPYCFKGRLRQQLRIFTSVIAKNYPVPQQSRNNIGHKHNKRVGFYSESNQADQKRMNDSAVTIEFNSFLRHCRSLMCFRLICRLSHFLILPFHSYFLTENTFRHNSKIHKTQKNRTCSIFNNNDMKEILS